MSDIFILIIEDRHADTDARPYATELAAITAAEAFLAGCDQEDVEQQELNDAMIQQGWVFYATYSCESDSVWVVRREMDAR